jgi:hypothetical protein
VHCRISPETLISERIRIELLSSFFFVCASYNLFPLKKKKISNCFFTLLALSFSFFFFSPL